MRSGYKQRLSKRDRLLAGRVFTRQTTIPRPRDLLRLINKQRAHKQRR